MHHMLMSTLLIVNVKAFEDHIDNALKLVLDTFIPKNDNCFLLNVDGKFHSETFADTSLMMNIEQLRDKIAIKHFCSILIYNGNQSSAFNYKQSKNNCSILSIALLNRFSCFFKPTLRTIDFWL